MWWNFYCSCKRWKEILSNNISSQIEIHKEYGGVVPEIASRQHIKNIATVLEESLEQAKITLDDVDYIAVTYAPGLIGAFTCRTFRLLRDYLMQKIFLLYLFII